MWAGDERYVIALFFTMLLADDFLKSLLIIFARSPPISCEKTPLPDLNFVRVRLISFFPHRAHHTGLHLSLHDFLTRITHLYRYRPVMEGYRR